MQVIERNSSPIVSKNNSINTGLASTMSAFSTFKPMGKKKITTDIKQINQHDELKIESDAYDLIRKAL